MRTRRFGRLVICATLLSLVLGLHGAEAHDTTAVVGELVGFVGGTRPPLPPETSSNSFFFGGSAQLNGAWEGKVGAATYDCNGDGTRTGNLLIDILMGDFTCARLPGTGPGLLQGTFSGMRSLTAVSISGTVHDGDGDTHQLLCGGHADFDNLALSCVVQ